MKTIYFFLLMAVVAGAVLPVQAGLNAKMGRAVGDPVYAALISFVIGSIGLFVYTLITKVELGQINQVGSVHWSVWSAGFMGAFYVAAVIVLVPKIGAALTFGLVITGQLGLSLLLDHFGLLGLSVHAINWQRTIGMALIVGGVLLIRNY
ncbi:MAG: DMT family transporter [Lewinellaceae bacterium]|nr:DMT family transporter [Saprospiraceae bacterium]MCB9338975.1 DMT family transporter [Lewinellaceae bacterium]